MIIVCCFSFIVYISQLQSIWLYCSISLLVILWINLFIHPHALCFCFHYLVWASNCILSCYTVKCNLIWRPLTHICLKVVIADGFADHFQFTQTSTCDKLENFHLFVFQLKTISCTCQVYKRESHERNNIYTDKQQRYSRAVTLFESMFFGSCQSI